MFLTAAPAHGKRESRKTTVETPAQVLLQEPQPSSSEVKSSIPRHFKGNWGRLLILSPIVALAIGFLNFGFQKKNPVLPDQQQKSIDDTFSQQKKPVIPNQKQKGIEKVLSLD